MTTMNRQFLLAARPVGLPKDSDFNLVETPVPMPGENQFLVRAHYLSVDPYMRGRMNDVKSYAKPVQIGEVMTGGVVGEGKCDDRRDGLVPPRAQLLERALLLLNGLGGAQRLELRLELLAQRRHLRIGRAGGGAGGGGRGGHQQALDLGGAVFLLGLEDVKEIALTKTEEDGEVDEQVQVHFHNSEVESLSLRLRPVFMLTWGNQHDSPERHPPWER